MTDIVNETPIKINWKKKVMKETKKLVALKKTTKKALQPAKTHPTVFLDLTAPVRWPGPGPDDAMVEPVKGEAHAKCIDFDYIQISTRTEVVISNLIVDLHAFHAQIPIFELDIPRHLKNKKDIIQYITNYPEEIPYGSIITSELENKCRGFKIKKRRQWEETKTKHFRNSIAMVIYLDKLINIKIPKKGKIQFTGCGTEGHVYECIEQIWKYLNPPAPSPKFYSFDPDVGLDYLHVVVRAVMTNKDFNLGFKIDRENLDKYINMHTRFHSLLETSVGYTGVNIKASYEHRNTDINTLSFRDGRWIPGTIDYNTYLEILDTKDRKKEINKKRKNTFLAFYSGSCIMSGMNTQYMKESFYEFINIIKEARSVIEEDVSKFS
jgi:hypothetical protein